MADEPKKDHPEDISSILADLDAILTDAGRVKDVGKESPEPAQAAPPPNVEVPAPEEFLVNTTKDQIRRVAYVYTLACAEVEKGFAAFLSQVARTISKKPLFLREVLSHEVGNASDPNAVLEKAKQVKAVAILAVVEDWPSAKIDELSQACARADLLFRSVAPSEAQKKSTAVDIIVDMILLSGED